MENVRKIIKVLMKTLKVVLITGIILFAGIMIYGAILQKQSERRWRERQNDTLNQAYAMDEFEEGSASSNNEPPEIGTYSYADWITKNGGAANINNDPSYVWDEDSDPCAEKFKALFEPADDEFDFMWANDYTGPKVLKYAYLYDSGGYSNIYGYEKPTYEDLCKAIDENHEIDEETKVLLKEYVGNWLRLWPESDFTLFRENLKTLKILRRTEGEIQRKALNIGTVACYIPKDNEVWLNKDAKIEDRNSNDYIVFMHEITHAARTSRNRKVGDVEIAACFFQIIDFGLYEDESLLTYFCYEMQGLNNRSIYYTFQSNIYRQLLKYLDYDGADYMNHSVNYFCYKLQEYFDSIGESVPAYHFINLVDAEAEFHYKGTNKYGYVNFCDLYRILVESYALHNLSSEMSIEEANEQFDIFYEDITFNFNNLSDPYPEVTEELFRIYWDKYVSELGISI